MHPADAFFGVATADSIRRVARSVRAKSNGVVSNAEPDATTRSNLDPAFAGSVGCIRKEPRQQVSRPRAKAVASNVNRTNRRHRATGGGRSDVGEQVHTVGRAPEQRSGTPIDHISSFVDALSAMRNRANRPARADAPLGEDEGTTKPVQLSGQPEEGGQPDPDGGGGSELVNQPGPQPIGRPSIRVIVGGEPIKARPATDGDPHYRPLIDDGANASTRRGQVGSLYENPPALTPANPTINARSEVSHHVDSNKPSGWDGIGGAGTQSQSPTLAYGVPAGNRDDRSARNGEVSTRGALGGAQTKVGSPNRGRKTRPGSTSSGKLLASAENKPTPAAIREERTLDLSAIQYAQSMSGTSSGSTPPQTKAVSGTPRMREYQSSNLMRFGFPK